jgi:neutral ceramidase
MRTGIAAVDYTPPVGLPLMGNLRKEYGSTGVHDPLYAKAIVFADAAGTKAALLAVDVCMLSRDQVSMMRAHIAARCDIPAEHVLIAATHIHSGPATVKLYVCPKADDAAIRAFLTRAAEAVVVANADLQDSTLCAGYAVEDRLSFYRRIRGRDGKCHMNWESIPPELDAGPLGRIDPQIAALAIAREGRPAAVMVNFPLHPAIVDYANDRYSAEYPGFLAEAMRRIEGDHFETLFFNGCCGNINHINHRDPTAPRRGFEMAQRVGYMLAAGVKQAMNRAAGVGDEPVAVSRDWVTLKRLAVSEERYRWSLDALERMKRNPPSGEEDGLPDEYSAETWIEMYRLQNQDDRVEVMVVRVGDVGIVGLPGEVFCEFGVEIKTKSPAPHTLVFELANDAIGYLPTPEAFTQGGGYEVTPGVTRYEKDAGQRLAASALRQLKKLFA